MCLLESKYQGEQPDLGGSLLYTASPFTIDCYVTIKVCPSLSSAIPRLFPVSCLYPPAPFVPIVLGIRHGAVTLTAFLAHLLLVCHFHVSKVRPLPTSPLLPGLRGHRVFCSESWHVRLGRREQEICPFFDGETELRKAVLAKGTQWPRQAGGLASGSQSLLSTQMQVAHGLCRRKEAKWLSKDLVWGLGERRRRLRPF